MKIPTRYHPLKGRDWINQLTDEDKRVFGKIGYLSCLTGDNHKHEEIPLAYLGGQARAKQGKRDKRGRFIPHIDNIPNEYTIS